MREDKPLLMLGYPPCRVFSMRQHLNRHKNSKEWRDELDIRKGEAIRNVKLFVFFYRMLTAEGGYFLHAHPHGATSWELEAVENIKDKPGVARARGRSMRNCIEH